MNSEAQSYQRIAEHTKAITKGKTDTLVQPTVHPSGMLLLTSVASQVQQVRLPPNKEPSMQGCNDSACSSMTDMHLHIHEICDP